MECTLNANAASCTCTYGSCSRKGRCCACITYHRRNSEIPGCLFPPDVERTYDRSVEAFVKAFNRS